AADLCLWLLDASALPVLPPPGLERTHLVVNKIDLPPAWPLDEVAAVRVSAQTGAGLAELCEALARWLVPLAPPPGAAVPFTAALADGVAGVGTALGRGDGPEGLRRLEALCRECG